MEQQLFEKRISIGKNILDIIRDNGYTKSSFAKVMDITRPTLDQLLAGEIDSLPELNKYVEKIKTVQGITEEQLLKYVPKYNSNNDLRFIVNNEAGSNDQLSSIHSFNALKNHEMNDSAKEMFSILNDVLTICEVYYSRNGI
jgi:transcriptional regulator with XRE-family HTH domain